MTRLTDFAERIRSSLFYEPMLFVVAAVVLGQTGVAIDSTINRGPTELPLGLTSTVESARAVLTTIASATITVAGIAFSVSLLIIQLASSQYSPRVVHGLFRDPFNKRVMGLVVGTFTYCLIVLRSVRSPLDEDGQAVVPNLSVGFAVLLGLAAILAIIAFINHSAHTMDVSQILHQVTAETIDQIHNVWLEPGDPAGASGNTDVPAGQGFSIANEHDGWLQRLNRGALLDLAEPGGTVQVRMAVGHYAVSGSPLCTIWPPPEEGQRDSLTKAARRAVTVGKTRTMTQDVSYGVRQLADVALKALSPGVNDPTTAQDAIFHLTAVLSELLRRDPPSRCIEDDQGRRLIDEGENEHIEIIALAFDELRQFAASQPRVCIYLLESLAMLVNMLEEAGLDDRAVPLRQQARLVVDGAHRTDQLEYDLNRVREAYQRRFA